MDTNTFNRLYDTVINSEHRIAVVSKNDAMGCVALSIKGLIPLLGLTSKDKFNSYDWDNVEFYDKTDPTRPVLLDKIKIIDSLSKMLDDQLEIDQLNDVDLYKVNMNKKALVIYHRVDYDGLFSYAIVKNALENGELLADPDQSYEVTGFGYNHYDSLDNLPNFDGFDLVVIADIALPSDKMVELKDNYSNKVIWIDHHITTINDSIEKGYDTLTGVRRDGVAACKLCWQYFMCTDLPKAIDLIATNDIWDHETYDWENEVQALQYGLNVSYGLNAEKIANNIENIIRHYSSHQMEGLKVKSYMEDQYKTWCERYSFPVTVDGKWKGICMICPVFSSKVFKSIGDEYDCCVVVEKNGKDDSVYNISIYSDKGIDFSCGEYMKYNYNGGGHKGAAGGKLTLEQFVELITKHTV